jgi:hypothetical protein
MDILKAIFFRNNQDNPVWTAKAAARFPCSYEGFSTFFYYDSGVTVCADGFYSNAENSLAMRYALLSPDHLQDAIKLNPVRDFDTSSTHK